MNILKFKSNRTQDAYKISLNHYEPFENIILVPRLYKDGSAFKSKS